jgi:hypothetical protein
MELNSGKINRTLDNIKTKFVKQRSGTQVKSTKRRPLAHMARPRHLAVLQQLKKTEHGPESKPSAASRHDRVMTSRAKRLSLRVFGSQTPAKLFNEDSMIGVNNAKWTV